jgi:hypothetical protein
MYAKSSVAGVSVVAGSSLAATGVNVLWLCIAGFALVSAGLALLRIIPRREA